MISFKTRSYEPEILDSNDISPDHLIKNLSEIDNINHLLGGHHTTLKGINKFVTQPGIIYTIVDFGCGSGDTLKYISEWIKQNNFQARLYGIDNNAETIKYATQNCASYDDIILIHSDFRDEITELKNIDIGISCLFCHHLDDSQLREYLMLMKNKCKLGFIINDLHRHPVAYYSIKFLTKILNGSKMLQNDAPLSVLRSFKKNEFEKVLNASGISNYIVQWNWAFRFLVTVKNNV